MKKKGAQIIIDTLIENGADTVFGYPGGAVLDIYDELYKNSDRITHHITCHEQGAAHAADAYARASGKTGVVIATSGPGATNLVTGIATAYLDSVPMVAITGNVATPLIGRDSFQEVDITGITMPITKHNYTVRDITMLADTIREAFILARSGRPGPVLVDIPKDIQIGQCEVAESGISEKEIVNLPKTGEAAVAEAVSRINAAKRPYIYSGGGVINSNASAELIAFADKIGAPIGLSMMGLSAVPNANPRNLGMVGMHGYYAANKALAESDMIIAVGTRFSDRATGNKKEFANEKIIIHIDIDPAEIGKNIDAYTGLTGDIKTILTALNARVNADKREEWNGYFKSLKVCKENCMDMQCGGLNPQFAIESVAARAEADTVVATDVGQHQMWTAQYYKFKKPRTFVTSGGLGTMGFGMGAAIGASIANGKKRTVLFTSDGSFHMNMNELATAVTNKLPLIVMILNNNALGMVRQWQTFFYEKRYSQTTLNRQTDFVKLAQAFGASGARAATREELTAALDKAFAANGPFVIDCIIDCDEQVLPMIPAGKGFKNIILRDQGGEIN